ncbi:MAG: response regulator [Gemmatimonadales bacterium]
MSAELTRLPAVALPTDILLVEDSALDVELTVKPLHELYPDGRIEVVRDGEEALDFLLGRGAFRHRSGAPVPRLVLLNLKLPKVDGLEVLGALRANARTSMAPVVVLTSSNDPRELAQCYQLGANSCVQKPVRHEEFRAAIQAIGRYWLGLNQVPVPVAARSV